MIAYHTGACLYTHPDENGVFRLKFSELDEGCRGTARKELVDILACKGEFDLTIANDPERPDIVHIVHARKASKGRWRRRRSGLGFEEV